MCVAYVQRMYSVRVQRTTYVCSVCAVYVQRIMCSIRVQRMYSVCAVYVQRIMCSVRVQRMCSVCTAYNVQHTCAAYVQCMCSVCTAYNVQRTCAVYVQCMCSVCTAYVCNVQLEGARKALGTGYSIVLYDYWKYLKRSDDLDYGKLTVISY